VLAVRDHLTEFGDALIVVVTFTDDVARLERYRQHLDVPFPILADADRVLYRLLGAQRGSLRQVWSPGTMKMYARLLRQGRKVTSPTEDTRQLGADLLADRQGQLAQVWRPPSPDARPSVSELVDAVTALPT
jgi:hypothetical protein